MTPLFDRYTTWIFVRRIGRQTINIRNTNTFNDKPTYEANIKMLSLPEMRRSVQNLLDHSRSRTSVAMLFTVAALGCTGVAGCATAPQDAHGLDVATFNHVQDICRSTIGVDSTDVHFSVCVDELASISAANRRSQTLARLNAECTAVSPHDDSERALCVLQHDQPPTASETKKSYYWASNEEIHHRIEASCAKLGLNPADAGFENCVSSIQAAFSNVDMPPSN